VSDRASRYLAAGLGAPAAAASVAAALASLPGPWPFALGFHLFVPLWVALACGLPSLRSGRAAWLVVAALALPSAGVLLARGLA
jgi:hypothetical protein